MAGGVGMRGLLKSLPTQGSVWFDRPDKIAFLCTHRTQGVLSKWPLVGGGKTLNPSEEQGSTG